MTASLKEIYRATSQNGRWGLALVSEGIFPEDLRQPVQATITALGSAEGHDVFRLVSEAPAAFHHPENLSPDPHPASAESPHVPFGHPWSHTACCQLWSACSRHPLSAGLYRIQSSDLRL